MNFASPTVRCFPHDRKQQIIEASCVLFVERGYRNVSMTTIADRVGITAGALYRHFSSKSELLGAVIEQIFEEVTPSFGSHVSLADALAESSERAVANRDIGMMWWREEGNLPDDRRAELLARLGAINRQYRTLVLAEHPTLSAEQAEILAWGIQSVFASPSSHKSQIAEPEFRALLAAASAGVCGVELTESIPLHAQKSARLEPVSKREALLGNAIVLFEEKGYDATALGEVGAAAGVTGPNLYTYFSSKAELLQMAVERGSSTLWVLLRKVLRGNFEPERALADLVRGYVELVIDRTILTSLQLQTDCVPLSDVTRTRHSEYVIEWTALLRSCRPELDETQARVLVYTALNVVHILARIEHLRFSAAYVANITAMTSAVLFSSWPALSTAM